MVVYIQGTFPLKFWWAEYVCFFCWVIFLTDSAIVNHHFAAPPCGRIIVESFFPSASNGRESKNLFKYMGFLGGIPAPSWGTLQFLGDAFFHSHVISEMEFVISRCHFDLSKIFWNDSVLVRTANCGNSLQEGSYPPWKFSKSDKKLTVKMSCLEFFRRSVTGNWTKKKCQNSKSSEDLGFLHIWWWFYGSSFGVVFSPMLSPLPTKFKHLPFWSTA